MSDPPKDTPKLCELAPSQGANSHKNAKTITIAGMSWSSGAPELRLREGASASSLVALDGFSLNYRADPEQGMRCIGHKPFRDVRVAWADCDNVPLHDGRLCDRCAASDATFASQLHHAHNKAPGELDPGVLKHLEQPNELYLAAFRDGSLKIGTSTAPRLRTRLSEQGAWLARVVATATDGFAVRSIEDRVTVTLGLPQAVSIVRKLDGLERPWPDSRLHAELELWSDRVHELVIETADPRLAKKSEEWRFNRSDDQIWNGLHRYPLKASSGSHHLEFFSACGRIAVVGRPGRGDRFTLDVRSLYGVPLEVGDHVPDELAVQDSLF